MTIGHAIIGSGKESVLVLHGWFGDHTVFEPMFPYLDTGTFTYAFLDYRGYGLSRNQTGEHSITEIAGDAIKLVDYLGWEQFHVLGHSMGGMAMQRVALDASGRVISGIALTPVPASGVSLDADGEGLFGGAPDKDENRRAILDFTTGNRLSGCWLDWRVLKSHETTTQDAFADYLVAWTKTDFSSEVKGLETPVLVLIGEHDQALNKEAMEQTYMAWLPNAHLDMIPNAGHYPMQETPVHLATRIEAFMREYKG